MAAAKLYCPLPEEMEAQWTRFVNKSKDGYRFRKLVREEKRLYFQKAKPYTVTKKTKSTTTLTKPPKAKVHNVDYKFGIEYRYYLNSRGKSREEIDKLEPELVESRGSKEPFPHQGKATAKASAARRERRR